MSGTDRHAPSNEVLSDRIKSLRSKIDALESKTSDLDTKHTEILVEIRVLGTKVGFMAAGIGVVTGTASGLLVALATKFLT